MWLIDVLFFLCVCQAATTRNRYWVGEENPLFISTRVKTDLTTHTHDNSTAPHNHVCVEPPLTFSLENLPSNGAASEVPWSDSYWPNYQGGLANRWSNKPDPLGFGYGLHSKQSLQNMNYTQLKNLSPAEKYDIFQRRYDYPTVRSEWNRTNKDEATWVGICHGW